MSSPTIFSGDYYIDWIRETLDGHWRGSGNPVVVRHHLIPVLEQIPLIYIERFLDFDHEANDECLEIIKVYVAERILLEDAR